MMSSVARRFPKVSTVVALLVATVASTAAYAQTDYFWNAPTGGAGTWDISTGNWSTVAAGPTDYTWTNSGTERANFTSPPGTVTLGNPITAYGIVITNATAGNYVIAGGGNILTLSGAGGVINSSVAATISAQIDGLVGLTKTGSGTLTLSSANTYTGNTTVSGSTLIGIPQTSGSPFSSGNVILSGAILNLKSLTTNTTTTTVGNLTVSATAADTVGASGLIVDNTGGGPTNTTTFAAGNLVRGGNGSALVITPQQGLLGTRELVTLSNGNSLLTNGILPAWVVAAAGNSSTAGDFVTYGGSGVGVAAYSGDLSTSNNTNVVNQSSIPTISGPAAAYALKTNVAVDLNANTLTLGNGSGQSGLILNNGGSVTNGNVTFGPTEGMIYSQGTTALGSTGNNITSNGITLTGLGATTTTINGNIVDGTQPAKVNITAITSGSSITLNGTNSYTGGTTLSYQGTLNVGNNSAFGTGKVTTILVPGTGSPNLAASGGDRTIGNTFDLNGGLNFTGTNSLQFNGPIAVINANSGGTRTLQNQITTAGKTVTFGVSPGSSTITLGNPVANGGDGVGKILVVTPSASATTIINDVMQDPAPGGGAASGGLRYNGTAGGITRINAQNTYSGVTDLAGASTIQIGSDSIGTYPNITSGPFGVGLLNPTAQTNNPMQPVGGSRTVANAMQLDRGILVSNAASDPSASLTFTGPINMTANGRSITNNFTAATGGTLILGDPNNPSVINGATATGQTLTLANSTGNTVINDSIQEVGFSTGITTSGAGSLTVNGVINTTGLITIGSSGGTNAVPSPAIDFKAMNTYTGGTKFTGPGTLVLLENSTVGAPGSITSGPFGTGQIEIAGNGTNQHFRPLGGDRTLANAILLTTGIAMDNAASGPDSARNLTLSGPITMTNNRFISNGFIAGTTGGTFIIGDAAAPSTITLPTTTSFTLSLAALAGPIVVNDVIQDAGGQAGIVTINPNSGNNNPVTLNGANTYTGGTNVGASGTGAVQIGISTAGDFGSIISGPFGTNAVNMASTSATPPALTPIGANRTVSNAINLVSGNLAAANVTGQTFNLDLTGPLALGTANRSIINNMAGTLTLGSVGSPQSITLSQNAGITLTFSGQSAATTVVNDVIQNHLSGNAGNIAVSSGTVNLTNGNAYSGTTTVTGGKLLVNNTAGSSGTGIGAVNVNGGTLGGNGFIGGAVTVNATGHLGPGNSAGQLTINNSVAFTPGSNFDVEIGGTNAGVTYDQLAVDLTAALDGSLNVSLVNGFVDPAVNTDFTILTAAGGVTGIFSNLAFPDANWSVVYNANSVIARFTAPPGGVPGDFNSNGKVDSADYVMWRKNNGTNNALANDGGLGVPIGQAHYNLWRGNFGKPPGAGSGGGLGGSPVPEPMTMVTLLMGAAAIVGMRRKR